MKKVNRIIDNEFWESPRMTLWHQIYNGNNTKKWAFRIDSTIRKPIQEQCFRIMTPAITH